MLKLINDFKKLKLSEQEYYINFENNVIFA